MTATEVLIALQQLRYSPVRDRRLGLSFLASRAGVHSLSLYRAIQNGRISDQLAAKLAPVLQTLTGRHEPQRSATAHRVAFGPFGKQVRPRKPL